MKLTKVLLAVLLSAGLAGGALASGHKAEDEKPPVSNISYVALTPEIVTNYNYTGNRVGYVRVKVEIMTENPADKDVVTLHAPMLRDIVITTLLEKDFQTISTREGQAQIISDCKSRMEKFFQETEGRRLIQEVLFTNYVYQ